MSLQNPAKIKLEANKLVAFALLISLIFTSLSGCIAILALDATKWATINEKESTKQDAIYEKGFEGNFWNFTSTPPGARVYIRSILLSRVSPLDTSHLSSFQIMETPFHLNTKISNSEIHDLQYTSSFAVTMPGYTTIIETYDDIFQAPKHIHWNLTSKTEGLHGEYIAFSLSAAQKTAKNLPIGSNLKELHPKILELGGIRRFSGLVYDREYKDLILVGRSDSLLKPLTLDDLVVALRARFIHNEWPTVSIDPVDDSTDDAAQTVRFEGGIKDTQFGYDLFDADYRIKLIGLGYMESGVAAFPPYWNLIVQEQSGQLERLQRFWIYPILSNIVIRDDVAAMMDLNFKVFTESLSNNNSEKNTGNVMDKYAEQFSTALNDLFNEIAQKHTSFARIPGLLGLVALARSLEAIHDGPNLSYWLYDYRVKIVKTPETMKLVVREDSGSMLSGGIQMLATAMRLKAGDVSALREAVLLSRPSRESVSWAFSVGKWIIPLSELSQQQTKGELIFLLAQAAYFVQKGYYKDALLLLDRIEEFAPDVPEISFLRASIMDKSNRRNESMDYILKGYMLKSKDTLPSLHFDLVEATYKGNIDFVNELLVSNTEFNINTKLKSIGNMTLLHIAVLRNHKELVQFLLSKGADVNATDYASETPLHKVCGYILDSNMAEILLSKGADVNARANNGNTALHMAVQYGNIDLNKLLIAYGADINARNKYLNTPLMRYAASRQEADTYIGELT